MADPAQNFDVAIIGGGPGGYVCAIRASQLGLKVALIEKRETIGGTCVNVGCIPSKALLDTSEQYHRIKHEMDVHGITVSDVRIDVKRMMARKERVVKELTDGLNFLMNKNKITVFRGTGSLVSAKPDAIEIRVEGEKSTSLLAKRCVIATGSDIIQIPSVPVDGKNIITSDHAIALEEIPESMIVIGGGVIGLELGSVWNRLGTKVTVIEMMPDILMGLDASLRVLARRIFEKQGFTFKLETKVLSAQVKGNQVEVMIADKEGKQESLVASKVLVAVGRKPYHDSLGAEKVGVKINLRGRIEVDPHTLQTSVPGIYAIGDVIEGPMLAHKAEEEGVMVAEIIAGKPGHVNYDCVPFVVYTWPEIAWVGKNEDQLKAAGIEYNTGKYMFKPNGRAKAMNQTEGQVKILADRRTDKILGVHIVGPNASDLLGEAIVAMEFGGAAEDLGRSFHSHPTLSEVMKEAALDVNKMSIHQ
jgi:dihydrolipoamide dehydrogenase